MIKYWLKLWSVNDRLFKDAIESINDWKFDFIELYIVPDRINISKFSVFKTSDIDISIHLPHSSHWFNPIEAENNSEALWWILYEYIEYLNPFKIVLHPEFGDDIKVLERRLSFFNDKRIIIENMPQVSSILEDIKFYWYNLDQIKSIKKFSPNFCFDFAKAKSSAISQWKEIVKFSNSLISEMQPEYFHISWFLSDTEVDEHYDIWEWDKKLMEYMKEKIITYSKEGNIFVVFECRKKNWINNDIKNLDYFKNIK